jgi:hypothetical protein
MSYAEVLKIFFSSFKFIFLFFWEESDGVCSTQTAAGSDTAEGTQNNTVLVQMEEDERAIRAMPFVTTLSFVRAVKGKAEGWRVTLTCFACREYKTAAERSKRHQFTSRVSAPLCSPACRSCENDWRSIMATALRWAVPSCTVCAQ